MKLLVIGALAGLAAGLLGALCGVGGGIIMVPVFTQLIGMTQKQAVTTSMAVIIFTALSSTLSNMRAPMPDGQSLIQWPVVWSAAIASTIAAWFMSDIMRSMADATLTRIFAIFVIISGTWMLLTADKKKAPAPAQEQTAPR